MTNVDFLRTFCESKGYYFEHSRESLDFSNLFDEAESGLKIFHYTSEINPVHTYGKVSNMTYKGRILALYKSSIDQTIDVQRQVEKEDGKYELYIKDLIDNGGLVDEMLVYNNCEDSKVDVNFSSVKEVYNMFDWNGDGIWISYEMTIR